LNDFYLIAKIVSHFGTDGSVKITSFSDFPERFINLNKVFLMFFGKPKEFLVESVSNDKGTIVIKFKNFSSREAIKELIGKELFVKKEDLVHLPDDTYFIHDLIGSMVFRGENILGTIDDVLTLPANDVYVIKSIKGEELLIPALKNLIVSFDAKKKVLILHEEYGLFDDEYED